MPQGASNTGLKRMDDRGKWHSCDDCQRQRDHKESDDWIQLHDCNQQDQTDHREESRKKQKSAVMIDHERTEGRITVTEAGELNGERRRGSESSRWTLVGYTIDLDLAIDDHA